MKKFLGLILFITICGCAASPTNSNPTVTQTLSLEASTAGLTVSGTFTDVTTNVSTAFGGSVPIYTTTPPFSASFQTGKHDTIEFTATFSAPCTLYYAFGSTSSPTSIYAASSAETDKNGNYTSSEFTF